MPKDHDPSDLDHDRTASDSDRERMGYAILTPARRDGERTETAAGDGEALEDDRSPSESAGPSTLRPLFRVDTGE